MKLSEDYSPYGIFSKQILIITLVALWSILGVIIGLLYVVGTIALVGLLAIGAPIIFFFWGMDKQTKELFGEHQHWKDGLDLD